MWEGIAPTIAYDAAVIGEEASVPVAKAAQLAVPALVMAGSESYPFMPVSAEALAKTIPNAEYRVLDGQTHEVSVDVLAPVLVEFFSA
jgi:pimeloyl-ACP methyl ester carboxylesterase